MSSISKSGGTINISQNASTSVISYTFNGNPGGTISTTGTLTITNSTPTVLLKVIFDTDITISSNVFYIICGSDNIQFGSTSLNDDGSRPTIQINNTVVPVTNYPGFIRNGTSTTNGKNNIRVFNLEINAGTDTTMATGGGWVGQSYFGRGAANNYIVNCASHGVIAASCGGIVGSYAGSALTYGGGMLIYGGLHIIGCSSSKNIDGEGAGGIVGAYGGANSGNVFCQYCWSTGTIGSKSGGIFGFHAGDTDGTAAADSCYSIETISGTGAGGIFGESANGTATNCYSRGDISGTDAGGIFGNNDNDGTATNCYSIGDIGLNPNPGGGIYGDGSPIPLNCYATLGGSWVDDDANDRLTDIPQTQPGVGTIWVSTIQNTPYVLFNMGYTPYSFENIEMDSPFSRTHSTQTLYKSGQPVSSSAGITPNSTYEILSEPVTGLSIAPDTGVITLTSTIVADTYSLVVRNYYDDSSNSQSYYNITTINLIVSAAVPDPQPIAASGTITIQQFNGIISYIADSGSPVVIETERPLIINNNGRSHGVLKVLFETDITIHENWYIICGTSNIQFGDTSLNPSNGSRPKITIADVPDYLGFIQNGTNSASGEDNIHVFNLEINATGTSTLDSDSLDSDASAGWVGQTYFGSGASHNYIVNCSSNGPIDSYCGGIVGTFAGSGSGSSLKIIGCSSTGDILNGHGGGIAGASAGAINGSITCEYCWSSTSSIGTGAGGIFGSYAGDDDNQHSPNTFGTAIANNCWSTGTISNRAGGIFGKEAVGTCSATNCYSRGAINGSDSGGIFGYKAGAYGIVSITSSNCYSSGVIDDIARGIYGLDKASGATTTNCYIADGSWSNTAANSALQSGTTPTSTPGVGSIWVANGINPVFPEYDLNNMGYTPYAFVNITTSPTPDLKRTYTQTIQPGLPSSSGIRTGAGLAYKMLSGNHITMTMDPSTGIITTMAALTPNGTYNIVVRNNGSYNVTTFTLTVTSPPTPDSNICFPAGTPILTDQGNIPIEKINPKVHTIRNKKIEGIVRTKLMDEYLVCFEKNSLGPNVPCERTVMSGNHKVVVNGQMKMAREILNARSMSFGRKTNSTTIHPIRYNGQSMYNVLMEDYNVILVNNMVCETLDPDNKMADLHAHLKYMTHERQQMLIDKFNGKSEGNPSKGAPVAQGNPSKGAPVAQGNPSKNTTLKMKFR
jgi:hypothetical protein